MLRKALLAAIGLLVLSLVWVGLFGTPGPGAVDPVEVNNEPAGNSQEEPEPPSYEVLNETENAENGLPGIVVETPNVEDDQMEAALLDLTKDRDDTALVRLQEDEGPESRTYLVDFEDDTYELRDQQP